MSESQKALYEWFAAHDAVHRASDAYNARLALVRAEREQGDWSATVDYEYKALGEAERRASTANETLYQIMKTETEALAGAGDKR